MSDETITKPEATHDTGLRTTADLAVATATGVRFFDGDVELDGRDVTAIVDGPAGAFALVDGAELHARTSDGTWARIASLDDDGVGRCLVVHRDQVYVGGAEAGLWRLADGRLERVTSFDTAPTHTDWHTPWGGPPDIYSFATDGHDLYVGVHVGGILRTADGDRWEATIDLHDDVHQVTIDDDQGTLWAATGMRALAHSDDRGATWRDVRDGLNGTYALAVAVGAAGPVVSVSSGPHARDGRVYRMVNDRFVPVDGLPVDLDGAVGPNRLLAAGRRAAVALPNGDVYASDDAGATWSPQLTGIGGVHGLALIERR